MNLFLILLSLFSPKHAEHVASLGAPMGAASAVPALSLKPRQTNWVLTVAWNFVPDTNVTGYIVYWGPLLSMTNSLDVGDTNSSTLTFPMGGFTFVGVAAYDGQGIESDMNATIHWPLYEALSFSGSNLQCRASLASGAWVSTNSPWWGTNVTGSLFFRSTDPGGPAITRLLTQ